MRDQLKSAGLVEHLLWLLRRRRRFCVVGASMLPTLRAGDEVLVNPYAYRIKLPQVGDIVIVRHPFNNDVQKMVKRVVRAENGRFFLAGDNRTESSDSRSFGLLPTTALLGQVTSRLLPSSSDKSIN